MASMPEGPSAEGDDVLMPKMGVGGIPVGHTALLSAVWDRHRTVPSGCYKQAGEAFPVVKVDKGLATAFVVKHRGADWAFAPEISERQGFDVRASHQLAVYDGKAKVGFSCAHCVLRSQRDCPDGAYISAC